MRAAQGLPIGGTRGSAGFRPLVKRIMVTPQEGVRCPGDGNLPLAGAARGQPATARRRGQNAVDIRPLGAAVSVARQAVCVNIAFAALAMLSGATAVRAQSPDMPPRTRVGDAFYPAYPRLVLQSQNLGGQDVAAWTWDDKFVVTANAFGRTVFVWEVATGRLINKIAFPTLAASDLVEPWQMEIDKAGKMTLRVNLRSNDTGFCRNSEFSYPLGKAGIWTRKDSPDDGAPCLTDGSADEFPKSHNGLLTLSSGGSGQGIAAHLADNSLQVLDAGGRVVQRLEKPPPLAFRHAALSPNARTMAMIVDAAPIGAISLFATLAGVPGANRTQVMLFDLPTAAHLKPFAVDGFYGRVAWLDAKRVLLTQNYQSNARGEPNGRAGDLRAPTPARIIDTATGTQVGPDIADHCFVVPLKGDVLVGAGLSNCWDDASDARGLMRYDPGSGWRTLDEAGFKGRHIVKLAPSPDGSRVAVLSESPTTATAAGALDLATFDATSGAAIARTPLAGYETSAQLAYAPDGQSVVATLDGRHFAWRAGNPPAEIGLGTPPALAFTQPSVPVDGQNWYEFDEADMRVSSISLRGGPGPRSILMFDNVVAAGLMPDAPIYWAVTSIDGLKFWPASSGGGSGRFETISTWLIPEGHYFTMTPDRRYDTDLGGDSDRFRWIVTDTPFESLGPQTFMRDYFEPRLASRALACMKDDNCDQHFKAVPSVVLLNRALPTVEVTRVAPGPSADTALVTVAARPGSKPGAKFGKTSSAIYDLRLFRDGNLVARLPGTPDRAALSLDAWRAANLVPTGPDGVARYSRLVALPTGADVKQVRFSAYAFNEDRIKSETAAAVYDRPATTVRARRAFVLTIGIDAYEDPRLSLRFAARDADLISERLAALPGFAPGDVHRAALTAPAIAQGKPRRVSKETIAAAFGILAGAPREPLVEKLERAGFGDATALEAARPDDLVVIAYAGHGWADKTGNFYLIPSDARAIDPGTPPDTSGFVSAVDLSNWLRGVDAGQIALIIDACNSAASVDSAGFKPGPMGDANLGQLAFDKGIRILAATQNADVALEDAKLGHGLLSWALAGEGLSADGFGRADLDNDGAITLDEWLRYATERLPGLSEDVRLKRYAALATRDFDLVPLVPVEKPKPQEPALFDFTGRPSGIVLRRRTP